MRSRRTNRNAVWLLATVLCLGAAASAEAQDQPPKQQILVQAEPEKKPSLEIYGFAMLDIGHDFKQIHPDWFDTLRLTRLPTFENEFGEDHSTFAGVRQSRLGVRSSTPTATRRTEDHLRVRAVRHRRGLRADDLPAAPCMGRARLAGGRSVPGAPLPTLTCSRTRWNTGGPRVFRGTATCSSATRRPCPTPVT